jgi:dihydropyrimidinase
MIYDIVIRGGTVVTAGDIFTADIGIMGETIMAVGLGLDGGRVIDAAGKLVLPGGIDSHCHVEQLESDGSVHEESFSTAARSAFAGGTTTLIPFAPQFKGAAIARSAVDYGSRAARSPIDYALHQIITDPTAAVLTEELPAVIAGGTRSLKVFLTYDPFHVTDREYLEVLAAAKRLGALVCVHCETTRPSSGVRRRYCAPATRNPPPMRCRAPRSWNGRRRIARSPSPNSSISRSISSTSPARRSPTKLPAPKPEA